VDMLKVVEELDKHWAKRGCWSGTNRGARCWFRIGSSCVVRHGIKSWIRCGARHGFWRGTRCWSKSGTRRGGMGLPGVGPGGAGLGAGEGRVLVLERG
jgi:hypothetical protein